MGLVVYAFHGYWDFYLSWTFLRWLIFLVCAWSRIRYRCAGIKGEIKCTPERSSSFFGAFWQFWHVMHALAFAPILFAAKNNTLIKIC
jgi:hypothetical protein